MGSKGSDATYTIGYRYFLGVHAVLSQNKLRILAIKFAEKLAWTGSEAGGGVIRVNRKGLFGGKAAEGGVSGSINVLNGDAAQEKNGYLQARIGGVISAFRGVTSVIFDHFYFGNNPYLKKVAIKGVDDEIHRQWYPAKALIGVNVNLRDAEIYIALDLSGSMAGPRLAYMKGAVENFIESLKGWPNTIKLVGWSDVVNSTTQINDCTDDDYDTLISWVNALPVDGGTSFAAGVSLTTAFFSTDTLDEFTDDAILENEGDTGSTLASGKTRIVLFMTDGEPINQADVDVAVSTLSGLTGVDVYCFNINLSDTQYTEQLDNTPDDSVPVVSVSNSGALQDSLQTPFMDWADLNAVHIIRDILVYGNGGSDALIGNTFEAVADALYDEGMGLSMFWRNTRSIDDFMNDVKAHADLVTYIDRTTGKTEIKAIRNDYTIGSLFTYDTSNVSKWHDDIGRPLQKNLPNHLTVVYTKRSDGSEASISLGNIAAIQQVGRVIPEKIEYRGFTDDKIAGKVLLRDLSARTVPLLSGSIDVTYAPIDLNIGSPFIVKNSAFGIDSVVVRLTAKEETGGRNPKITLTFIEDKFDILEASIVSPDEPIIYDKSPKNSPDRLFGEVGYYPLVLNRGVSTIDDLLVDDPDAGIVSLAGSKPNNFHSSMDTTTNSGAGWTIIGSGGFMPASTLSIDMLDTDTISFDVVNNYSLRQIVAGSIFSIDNEIMRVDGMVISGAVVTMTVGRGCLDTVPEQHKAGTPVLFYGDFSQADTTVYTAGETIDGKILPKTSEGRLSLGDAITEQVTLNSRAIRPYPVGNLKMDGSFNPPGILDVSVPITWAHRDRTLQLTTSVEDYEDASIGPETGVAYTLEVRSILEREDFFAATYFFDAFDFFANDGDGTLIRSDVVGQDVVHTYLEDSSPDFFAATDFFDAEELPDFFMDVVGRAMRTQLKVSVARAGYSNWTTANVSGKHLQPPRGLEVSRGVAPSVTLKWSPSVLGDSQNVYRSTTPFTEDSLPVILAAVSASTSDLLDTSTSDETLYYYAVGVVLGSRIQISNVESVLTASGAVGAAPTADSETTTVDDETITVDEA